VGGQGNEKGSTSVREGLKEERGGSEIPRKGTVGGLGLIKGGIQRKRKKGSDLRVFGGGGGKARGCALLGHGGNGNSLAERSGGLLSKVAGLKTFRRKDLCVWGGGGGETSAKTSY